MTHPTESERGLPELPGCMAHVHSGGDLCWDMSLGGDTSWPVDLFTGDQMRAYALAAIEKDRAERSEAVPDGIYDNETTCRREGYSGGKLSASMSMESVINFNGDGNIAREWRKPWRAYPPLPSAPPERSEAVPVLTMAVADKARRALWSLLELETAPAGFEAAVIKDREKFSGFMKGVNGRIAGAVKLGTEAHDELLKAIEAAPPADVLTDDQIEDIWAAVSPFEGEVDMIEYAREIEKAVRATSPPERSDVQGAEIGNILGLVEAHAEDAPEDRAGRLGNIEYFLRRLASLPAVQQEGMVSRKGFMCLIDFQHHLENDSQPSPIFTTVENLRRDHKMVDECGIAEVEVRLIAAAPPEAACAKDDK